VTTLKDVAERFDELVAGQFRFLEIEYGCARTSRRIAGWLAYEVRYGNGLVDVSVDLETREESVYVGIGRPGAWDDGQDGRDRWPLAALVDVHEGEGWRAPADLEEAVAFNAAKLRAHGDELLRTGDFSALEAWEARGGLEAMARRTGWTEP
jgi:hypothetical protein